MEKISSFKINHMLLQPGIYVSRKDDVNGCEVVTYDVRVVRPNFDEPMTSAVAHTIEHMGAMFLRNHPVHKDNIIGWFPMGCLTGFYLVYKGRLKKEEIASLVLSMMQFVVSYAGNPESMGFDPESCGNYSLNDIEGSKRVAGNFLVLNDALGTLKFEYPNDENSKGVCTSSSINCDDPTSKFAHMAKLLVRDIQTDYNDVVKLHAVEKVKTDVVKEQDNKKEKKSSRKKKTEITEVNTLF